MSHFEKNLSLLQPFYPREVYYLEKMSQVDWIENQSFEPITSTENHLIVYGAGTGGLSHHLLPWLEEEESRVIYLFEDQEIPLRKLLDSPLGTDLLSHPRIQFYLFHDSENDLHPFNDLMWKLWGKGISFFRHPAYLEDRFEKLKQRVLFDKERLRLFVGEYLDYGIRYYQNFYRNLKKLPQSHETKGLFGAFKGMPALIVGAGPSLDKNVDLIRSIGSRGLVLSGGSGLVALVSRGIMPHLAAGIDPNPEQAERLARAKDYEGPFGFRLRLFPDGLDWVKGPKLYLRGAGGYDTADWIEKELQIEGGVVEEGFNIIGLLTSLAYNMGCNPIVYVGMDLGYSKGQHYAQGIEDKLPERESLVEVSDIFGDPLLTKRMWMQEAKWIAQFQADHQDILLVNATEGGMGIEGVENKTLEKVLDHDFKESYPNLGSLLSTPRLNVDELAIKKALEKLANSLIACSRYLKLLEAEREQSPKGSLALVSLHQEVAWDAVLSVFEKVWSLVKGEEGKWRFLKDNVEVQIRLMELNGWIDSSLIDELTS